MSENEPRTKVWVSRERTVRLADYENVKVSAGGQIALEVVATANEIMSVQKVLEQVVMDSLDRAEAVERARRDSPKVVLHQAASESKEVMDECPVCKRQKSVKYRVCYDRKRAGH